ncbi:Glycosyl hydrolase family 20, domain 2 [Cohnella sp. OV330]|uniref:beta-N-acetylhexosaminidase n=1 Tax=Cohnella sp. OV330 TaxID=1855288 RepID=UPI0008E6CEE4|nr:family 20 glycosylhydrolase [Cohnella sp. OV330]SFB58890.1 Glycosyl hydrolase family 20, domain 2 [Cohnella sp. OV330]
MTAPVYLFPQPRQYVASGGASPAAKRIEAMAADDAAARMAEAAGAAERLSAAVAPASRDDGQADGLTDPADSPAATARIVFDPQLHPQGYELSWDAAGLRLAAATAQGLHYALLTAAQMIEGQREAGQWAHCIVRDEPDFPVRGVMLDIGRGKIPKMDTLYGLVDLLSALKFNHLQLYMEGFAFDYRKYADQFPDTTPVTAAEFQALDAYAAARFIDLVPNQNCLGHMGPWLAKPAFRELAEHPDGMPAPPPIPFKIPPLTLNPVDPGSVALAKDLFDELLPNFWSEYANINLDEPFGLGTGASKANADKIGVGRLYLDYALRMIEIVRSHGKKTLMWGDVLAHHPEIAAELPGDVTVLHWNYDAPVPYEPHCRRLQESGVPYYVCPGTSTWSAITGRTDNMLANIADAASNGKAYGAGGLIVCDWGDGGHWQSLVASYPAYAYAAGAAWQADANLEAIAPLERHVSRRMLRERSGGGARLLLEMGRYYLLERSSAENMTYTSYLLGRGLLTRVELEGQLAVNVEIQRLMGGSGTPFELDYRYPEAEAWLAEREKELEALALEGADADITRAELANALRLIGQGAGLHRYVFEQQLPDVESRRHWLVQMKSELEETIREFERLWRARNRESSLADSCGALRKLLSQYEDRLRDAGESSQ